MSQLKVQKLRKQKRLIRTRKHVMEGNTRPRLTVARSNKHFYAQVIDDAKGRTLVAVSEKELAESKMTKSNKAVELGKMLAKKAIDAKVTEVVFDKGAYRYHGRVKAFADAAREGGLKF